MKVVLLLFAFLAVASATPLLGREKCTWGPSYWCQHIGTAKQCGAVNHCITVWKNNKQPPVTGTETCTICRGLIQDLKVIIASKTAQSEIKSLALKACALMKKEETAEEVCDTVVTMFLPEVIKMIESDVDPDKICGAVGLCEKKISLFHKLAPVMKLLAKSKVKSATCDECKVSVTIVEQLISKNATRQEVIQLLINDVCPRLPGELSGMCKSFVVQTVPDLFETIDEVLKDPASVCGFLKLCSSDIRRNLFQHIIAKFKPKNVKANPVECELCKTGINNIRNALKNKDTQEKIEDFLKKDVCPHLGDMKDSCCKAVDEYLPIAFPYIISELDPEKMCKSLGLCSSKSNKVKQVKMMQLMSAKPVQLAFPKATPLCLVCELVMREIDSMIGVNRTEAAIEKALHEVCSILPPTVKTECDAFVNQYAPLILKLLIEAVQPGMICRVVGLCAAGKEVQMIHQNKVAFETCDLMVRYLRVLVKSTRLEIDDALQSVCNFLPRKHRHTCRQLKSLYKRKLMKIGKRGVLHLKFNPRKVCKTLTNQPKHDGLVHLLGSSKCTYGPAFWCDKYENAAMCGAVSHCVEHVWKTKGRL